MADGINGPKAISLNGKWEMGFARKYTSTVIVPGIATDPTIMSNEVLWYKKEIKLPAGNWSHATLELKGARFQPQVYINGDLVDKKEGGMAPVFLTLLHKSISPGHTITIEIALASLKNVPPSDASFIPWADHFRSNVGSGLWDDVVLHLHGEVSIERIIPFIDFDNQKVIARYDLNAAGDFKGKAKIDIVDKNGKVLISQNGVVAGLHNAVNFAINGKLKSWSPKQPRLYYLKLTIINSRGYIEDQSTIPFGVKKFEIKDKQFYLNDQHFVAKGPTVVWHRWMRTAEGRELGYDTSWFIKNIVQRTKDLGGNYLRFHLGLPPEKFLDLCDRLGLAVQFEWSFFHGMPASKESLLIQYKSWLNLAMRHPSVSLIHPYNETGGDQLKTAWAALDELLPAYPPLVLEDRDVLHIHKYWWSLFENLGLYYDNASDFPKAVMSDEFGGNYLDEKGDLGSYSTVKETYLRFLGRDHTAKERLAFHAQANAKVAEYWRRIGAAGFSPFCALGSKEDGNHWFLGPLKEGNPKPVWNALAASFSPQSVSIEIWDRDFEPNQQQVLPVYVFNDESKAAGLSVKVTIENSAGKIFYTKSFLSKVNAFDKEVVPVSVTIPAEAGDYTVKAELVNKPSFVKYPVISAWDFRVVKAVVPANLAGVIVAVAKDEAELKEFLKHNKIVVVEMGDPAANIILTSLQTWKKIATGDTHLSNTIRDAIAKGKSVVMLDVGDRLLGQGYPTKAGDFGPLQSVARISNPKTNTYNLFGGIALKFTETAEPESHLHPGKTNRQLWGIMPDQYTRIWNGLRGGLIVPASDMTFEGLSAKAFLTQWKARGADEKKIENDQYFGYELQGFYEFSDKPNDKVTEKKLKDKLLFLVQDAPALANSINLNIPVAITNLSKGYKDAEKGIADNLIPLANCAKNLTQTPVALVDFGKGKGKLIVSQLLTSGRLAKGFGETGLYGIRYDEVAAQFVLNMMDIAAH
ncbi:MAG: glycoside hydrolase [Ferruginibacter sp.]|nr:glycoside hydrolase [Ferruginibacter sp.]